MTFTRRAVRNGLAAAGIGLIMAMALVTPAAASANSATAGVQSAWPNDTFRVCTVPSCYGIAVGGIVWGNRTAQVQGEVRHGSGYGVTVYFEAYAGNVKIDSDTRTAVAFNTVPYNFPIGDTDLVGGFDRLKIQVCHYGPSDCSVPVNADRDGVAEEL
jgi:hypothetical protein